VKSDRVCKRQPKLRLALMSAALVAGLASAQAALAQRGGEAFAGLAGSWAGSGTISTINGSERIRCRVSYALSAANAVHQDLRCASDSYNFQVSSNIVDQGGTISGTWSEVTRQVSGNVSGRVGGGTIQAAVSGAGFTAGLSISTSGNRQSVTIQPSGGDVRAVSVNLMRSR